MKHLLSVAIIGLAALLLSPVANSQANATLNILTLNGGQVNIGSVVDLQVTVGNTGPVSSIGVNKVRAQISIPTAIASALPNAQQTGLPAGWTILSNTGGVITVCNGSDVIPVGAQRQVFIKIQGNTTGGPSTIAGALSFGPGTGVCTGLGTLPGDITSDNTSTSTITVSSTLPVKLISFSAKITDCNTVLSWTTADQVNFAGFEIEKSAGNRSSWITLGSVPATTGSQAEVSYQYTDTRAAANGTEKSLYRLKMIDNDGRFTYSYILPVLTDCDKYNVYVFPNPVYDGQLNIVLSGAYRQADVFIRNAAGQVAYNSKLAAGTNRISTSAWVKGTYIVSVLGANGTERSSAIIIK